MDLSKNQKATGDRERIMNEELPKFLSIPKEVPTKGNPKAVTAAILPWCC